jgi:uncharacterized protein (DUF1786 family)
VERILAVDVGGGTQDIYVWEKGSTPENCIQLVLPSPTVLVAQKIRRAKEAGRDVFLHGRLMGGGASTRAVKEHLQAGLAVYATPEAALTFADDPHKVEALGVRITEFQESDAAAIRCGDLDVPMLERILQEAGRTLPDHIAVAVQDHGYSPHGSNRIFRFALWEQFMSAGGRLADLAYSRVPQHFTRMQAVKQDAPHALMMDTCGAALLGALTDRDVGSAAASGPVALVNLGNQHTFAALVHQEKVLAVFEHHTAMMTAEKLQAYLTGFFAARLTCGQVQHDGGHGCLPPPEPVTPVLVAVTGPRRSLLQGAGYFFAAPQGNMMLMGPFGLVAAMRSREESPEKTCGAAMNGKPD